MTPTLLFAAALATQLSVQPEALELRVGETARLEAIVEGADEGATVIFFSTAPRTASVTPSGVVTARRSGTAILVALIPAERLDAELYRQNDPGIRVEVAVTVQPSLLARLDIRGLPETLRVGERVRVHVVATDAHDEVKDVRPSLSVEDDTVASAHRFGDLFRGTFHAHPFYDRPRPDLYPGDASGLVTALSPGTTTLTASVDGIVAERELVVVPNPVTSIRLTASQPEARTGDVIRFLVTPADAPVRFALESHPDPSRAETMGAGAPAQILPDGRFVAEQAGLYTVLATSGDRIARATVRIAPRDVSRELEFVGQAPVRDRITSDLWVWEGLDGRDYAILGTWNADGHALFFDVTDPANMQRIAEVQVDARTVNDVKVTEDGRYAVITREGASNRRNGFVVLDVSNPRAPEIVSRFDEQLTGGVHNAFLYEDHVFAINNGRRWDVINIEDPTNPFRVSRFEGKSPGRSVHDVWVRDGIAFQAGNTDGIVLVDVGGGGHGGSPANPVEIGRLPQLTGLEPRRMAFPKPVDGQVLCHRGRRSTSRKPPSAGTDHRVGGAKRFACHGLDPCARVRGFGRAQGNRPLPRSRSGPPQPMDRLGRRDHVRRLLQRRASNRGRLGRARG